MESATGEIGKAGAIAKAGSGIRRDPNGRTV